MSNGENSISLGTVVGLGFILLGILNFYGSLHGKISTGTHVRLPGILFITVGITIIVIRSIKKLRE